MNHNIHCANVAVNTTLTDEENIDLIASAREEYADFLMLQIMARRYALFLIDPDLAERVDEVEDAVHDMLLKALCGE